jgi:hypothetical protein
VHQHAVAQSLGIALAGLCKLHDLVCKNLIGQIATVGKSKRDPSHFEREAHDSDRLRVESLTVQVRADRHSYLPFDRRECYRTLSHRRPRRLVDDGGTIHSFGPASVHFSKLQLRHVQRGKAPGVVETQDLPRPRQYGEECPAVATNKPRAPHNVP